MRDPPSRRSSRFSLHEHTSVSSAVFWTTTPTRAFSWTFARGGDGQVAKFNLLLLVLEDMPSSASMKLKRQIISRPERLARESARKDSLSQPPISAGEPGRRTDGPSWPMLQFALTNALKNPYKSWG